MIDQILHDIEQQGYCYLPNLLSQDHLLSLQPLFSEDFVPAKVGKASQKQRVDEIRGDWIKWLEPEAAPKELDFEISLLNELKEGLNRKFFFGIKEFEFHLAKYPAGSFYKKHLDRFEKDSSRMLSFIFYLHQEWSEKDGGELVLYDKQNNILNTILPLPGSMISFVSDEFPHEVKTCYKERRSLTGWMHSKIIY